jgi:hypothetical protein
VQIRGDPHEELPGEGLLRIDAPLDAVVEVVVDRVAERPLGLPDRFPLERHDGPQVGDGPVDDAGLGVDRGDPRVSLVLHHGSTPAFSR